MIRDCQIRAVELKDFNDVFELLKQLWPDNQLDYNRIHEVFKRNLNSDYKRLIGAQHQDKVVGFCSLTIKDNLWKQGLLGNVDELVIKEEYRGQGLGRKMMEKITDIAIEAGCIQLELDSAFHREKAHDFYKDLGFDARAYLFSKPLQ